MRLRGIRNFVLPVLCILFVSMSASVAHAQGPTPQPTPVQPAPPSNQGSPIPGVSELDKVYGIVRMVSDLVQGKVTPSGDQLFGQSQQAAQKLIGDQGAGIFFLDFADPNLGINQFAASVAKTLLALTPLYALAYLAMLVYSVYKERPIPNPILYFVLVLGVMIFLAAFAVILRGISDLGRALAVALSGGDAQFFARATLLDQVQRVLANMQNNGGLLSILALLVTIALFLVVLVELAYRGIALILLRLLGVIVIPISVLVEGTRPRAAGRVIAGFFESWFDLVSKVALLLIVIALAATQDLATYTWLILPAGMLLVALSWKFFSLPFTMLRDTAGRMWNDIAPEPAGDYGAATLPSSAEAARAREIDEARRRMLEEK